MSEAEQQQALLHHTPWTLALTYDTIIDTYMAACSPIGTALGASLPLKTVAMEAARKPAPQPAALRASTGRLPQLSMTKMDSTTAASAARHDQEQQGSRHQRGGSHWIRTTAASSSLKPGLSLWTASRESKTGVCGG